MIALLILLCTSWFLLVNARPGHSTLSSISLLQAEITAQSPGMPTVSEVKVVHHQDLNKKILVVLIVASAFLAGIVLVISCFWFYRLRCSKNIVGKRKQNSDAANGNSLCPALDKTGSMRMAVKKGSVSVMEYQLLEDATNNFDESNILSEGSHGCVYRASFNDKLFAAVKKMECQEQDVEKEFENELNWLAKVRHQNIVSLLGYCIHNQRRFIVYEMMENGSLESQLHGSTKGSALTWNLRMKIAVDIARGLEYLHEYCRPPVVHRDLKSSNILLASNFNAKLSDFGLAITSGMPNNDIKLSGTIGYVAPEYLLDGKLTDKSDVYAFGVVLVELLTGRNPVKRISPTKNESLVSWAMSQLTDRSKLPNIVDPVIKDTMDLKHLYQVAAVAILCVQQEPSYRPLITDVLYSLIPLLPQELGGSLRMTEPAAAMPSQQT